MAMNMMGLGFAFGAVDKGLGKMVDKTTKGIGLISGAVKTIGAQASKFSLGAMFNIPQQAMNTMQTIAADTRVTTTSVEEFGIQADKASRKAIVGMNLTSKESKKARKEMSSTAYSTGIDIGSITESWKSLGQNQVDVTKLGFKSFKEYSKFLQVTGQDGKEFAAGMGHAQHTLGMTGGEMQDLIETTLALGKQFDQGAEAVPAMIKRMKLMREQGAALFNAWGKDKTTKFIHSTTLVTGALQKSGMTFEQAESASGAFLQTLMQGKESFHALYTGIESDLGPLAQMLSENFMGPQEAFELLEKSPHEFMLKMSKATDQIGKLAEKQIAQEMGISDASKLSVNKRAEYDKKVKERNLTYTARFSQQMSKLVGADMTTMFMSESGKVMDQVEALGKDFEKVGGKKGSIAGVAKEFRTGRSPTVDFARAQALLVTQMKHLKGTMKDREFLGEYNQSSKLVMKTMKEMANKGGPVAKAMTTLVDLSNFGLGGVLSRLHPMGPALTTVVEKFAPYLQMLPAVAVAFKALFSPLTLVVAAIGGIYLALKYPKEAQKAFASFAGAVERFAPKIIGIAKNLILGVAAAIARVFVFIWDKIDWAQVKTKLIWVASKIGEGIKWALLKVLNFAEMLIQAFGNINFDTIRKYLTIGFKYAFYAIVLAVGWVLKQLPALLTGTFKILYAVIFGFFDGIRDAFKEQFPRWAAFFDVFFATIKYGFIAITAFMAARWIALSVIAMAEATKTFMWRKKLWLMSQYMWRKDQAMQIAGWVAKQAKAAYYYAWSKAVMLEDWAIKKARFVQEKMQEEGFFVWKMAKMAVWAAFSVAKFAVVGAAQAAMFIAGKIQALIFWAAAFAPVTAIVLAIAAIAVGIYAIIEYWDEIVDYFKDIGKRIGKFFSSLGGDIYDFITAPIDGIKSAYNSLSGFLGGIADSVGGFFGDVGDGISGFFSDAVDFVTGSSETSAKSVKDQMNSVKVAGKSSQGWFKELTSQVEKDTKSSVSTQAAEGARLGVNLGSVVDKVREFAGKAADSAVNYLGKMAEESEKGWRVIFGSEFMQEDKSRTAAQVQHYDELFDAMMNAKAGSKGFQEAHKALNDYEIKYLKDYGVEAGAASLQQKRFLEGFGVQADFIDELSKSNVTAAASVRTRQNAIVDAMDVELAGIRKALAAHQINDDEAAQRRNAAKKRADEARNELSFEIAFAMKGLEGLQGAVGTMYEGVKADAAMATAIASKHMQNLTQSAQSSLASLAPDLQDKMSELTRMIQRAQAAELAGLKQQKLSVEEFEKQSADIASAYADKQKAAIEVGLQGQIQMTSGIAGAKDEVLSKLDGLLDTYKGKIGDVADSSLAEVTNAASQAFGVTGREAMSFLKDMAGIDPETLKKSLESIRKQYIGFLEDVQNKGKNLLVETSKQFGEYQGTFENHWKDMETFANDYGKKILTISQNLWHHILSFARNGSTEMTVAATAMITTLEANFSKVNILDILTAGGKIKDWAFRIVDGLQRAFAGKNPFDSAIEMAARNARSVIGAMAAQSEGKGTITPVNEASYRQVASESARSKVKDDLIAATHNPMWSEKVIEQNETTNRVLENGFRTLLMLNGTESQKRQVQRDIATIDLREARD